MKNTLCLTPAFVATVLGLAVIAACNSDGGTPQGKGGQQGGGIAATGGNLGKGGGSAAPATGGSASGGASAAGGVTGTGGSASGGTAAGSGGIIGSTGGATGPADASPGGAGGLRVDAGRDVRADAGPDGISAGGSGPGGITGNGGAGTGGVSGGGGTAGRSGTGGATGVGGAGTGGVSTGGTGACDWSDPPSSIGAATIAWINQSWSGQLGSNVRNLKRWLLDSAYLGKGQINVCVRWGASTAPSPAVKTGAATAMQKWFGDWFSQLDGYGCFPYPNVTVKITGWAVKSGHESWVSDVTGTDAKLYTETDGSGEPKCPDSCSFFSNPSHKFPSCPGGEAFHHDYWLWIDDGNAAAGEGGDWGVREPVAALDNALKNVAYDVNTMEHEMGHGFGFQDYYDWNQDWPVGSSLMIIKDPLPTSPTLGDKWLIRRLWKEQKALRGW